jgi:hypothetical protein
MGAHAMDPEKPSPQILSYEPRTVVAKSKMRFVWALALGVGWGIVDIHIGVPLPSLILFIVIAVILGWFEEPLLAPIVVMGLFSVHLAAMVTGYKHMPYVERNWLDAVEMAGVLSFAMIVLVAILTAVRQFFIQLSRRGIRFLQADSGPEGPASKNIENE